MIPRWLFACAVCVPIRRATTTRTVTRRRPAAAPALRLRGGRPPTGGASPGAGGPPTRGQHREVRPVYRPVHSPAGAELDANVPEGFCAFTFATGIAKPRGILVDSEEGTVLVAGNGSIVALWDDDGDGVSGDGERATLASASGLNHGIAVHDGYLYASSPTTVYRWSYAADRAPLGEPSVVIRGVPSGGHSTRTLVFDEAYLYVSVGSGSNVDPNPSRAGIFRFPIADLDEEVPFADGETFASASATKSGCASIHAVASGASRTAATISRAPISAETSTRTTPRKSSTASTSPAASTAIRIASPSTRFRMKSVKAKERSGRTPRPSTMAPTATTGAKSRGSRASRPGHASPLRRSICSFTPEARSRARTPAISSSPSTARGTAASPPVTR